LRDSRTKTRKNEDRRPGKTKTEDPGKTKTPKDAKETRRRDDLYYMLFLSKLVSLVQG